MGCTANSNAAARKIAIMNSTGTRKHSVTNGARPPLQSAMTRTEPTGDHPTRTIDAVVCDIDGCLCDENGGPFDLENLAKIRTHNELAQESGDRPILTVCSGRPVGFVEAMTRLIGNRTLPAIGEMGVWIHRPHDAQSEIDPAITHEHLESVRGLEAHYREVLAPQGVTMQPGKAASVTFWHEDTNHLREVIEPGVRRLCEERGWPFRVSMSWYYINCDLAHVSKATGISRFREVTGFAQERLAGIGDTTSDLAIREQVGFFACPANAIDELKDVADYVAEQPEAAGVVEILDVISRL